jgi:hypothetical protein
MNFENIKWIEIRNENHEDDIYTYLKHANNLKIEVVENKLVIYIKGNDYEKL